MFLDYVLKLSKLKSLFIFYIFIFRLGLRNSSSTRSARFTIPGKTTKTSFAKFILFNLFYLISFNSFYLIAKNFSFLVFLGLSKDNLKYEGPWFYLTISKLRLKNVCLVLFLRNYFILSSSN